MTDAFARRAEALARDSYYEATATRPAADDPVLDGTLDVDVCVIGAGFAGLSVALDCRARAERRFDSRQMTREYLTCYSCCPEASPSTTHRN